MVKNIILRKITREENERLTYFKKIFGVKTAAGALRKLLGHGRL